MILGVVADDFTGASDIGLALAEGGLATVQYVGVPEGPAEAGVEAGVVALRSRTAPVGEAVAAALAALDWLRAQGCRRFVLKVCSTFDSTPEGNIGPVAEAMMARLGGEAPVAVCPAAPALGRTVYRGHLFVGDRLLHESGMEAHPLTPMTDPDLARWLARQARGPVGRVPWEAVEAGAEAARAALLAEARAGRRLAVCDALTDANLRALGRATEGFPLVVGGSGIALGLPEALGAAPGPVPWAGAEGPAVALAGSCSRATRAQVAAHEAAGHPVRRLDVGEAVAGRLDARALAAWALERAGEGAVPLLASSDAPEAVAAAQRRHGRARVAGALEGLMGALAAALVEGGARRLVVAGGETSGAVVGALGLRALRLGPAIDPGVPALLAETPAGAPLALALKSGNFGREGFFAHAAAALGVGGA